MASVAPGSLNTLRSVRLRLCALRLAPPPPPPSGAGADGPPLIQSLLDAVKLSVLKEAYVILVPIGDGNASLSPSAEDAILARTTSKGELVSIEEAEADGSVPTDPARTLLFSARASYACFWTTRAELFKKVWQATKADPVAALTAHPFNRFEVGPHNSAKALDDLPLKGNHRYKLGLLLHGGDATWDGKLVHGTYAGAVLRHMGAEDVEAGGTYVIARSDALAALYLAELVNRHALDLRAKTAEDFAVFEGIRDLVRHAEQKLRVKALDDELSTIEFRGKRYPANEWNQEYYEYAYACAKARVPRKLFWKAVNLLVTQDDWKEAANEIWSQHHIPHPSADERGWSFKPCTPGVLKYFDFYDFGFRNASGPWNGRSQIASRTMDKRLGELRLRLGAFLQRRAPYQRFLQELDAHCPEDVAVRKKLHDWFLDTALAAKYAWWAEFAVESDQAWQALEMYAGWIATANDKLGELFGAHFGDPNEALRYNEVLEENVDEFERLFKKLKEYDKRFKGRTVKRRFGEGLRIEANFETGTFLVKDAAGTAEVGPVRFLVEVESVPKDVKVELPRKKSRAMRRRFKQVTKEMKVGRAYVPEVPFKTIHTWPAWMAAFGDTLALVIALKNLAEDWRTKDKLEVVGKMSMNTFQAIGSLSSAFYFTFRAGKTIPGLLRFTGAAGQVIEAYYNVKEGLILMFDAEESAVMRALERNDEVEAIAQMVKGWVLVSSVVPGVVGFGGALVAGGAVTAAAAAAMGPLAIGLAVGAVLVLGVEIFLYQHRGPDDAMEPVAERLEKAVEDELGKPGQYEVSRTVDQIGTFSKEAGRVLTLAEA